MIGRKAIDCSNARSVIGLRHQLLDQSQTVKYSLCAHSFTGFIAPG